MKTIAGLVLVMMVSATGVMADGAMGRLAGACRNGSVLWVGSRDGSAYVSFDRSRTWTRVMVASQSGVQRQSRGTVLLAVYPNPAHERAEVRFRLATAGHAEIVVHDMSGRVAGRVMRTRYPAGEHQVELDLSSVSPGSYIVAISGEGIQPEGILVHVTR